MTKKEIFVNEISTLLREEVIDLSEDALAYFEAFKGNTKEKEKPLFTENGKLVFTYMRENKEVNNNLFKAKEIGEGLGITSRTASGAMRKLVTDGFVSKVGDSPAIYSLSEKADTVELD